MDLLKPFKNRLFLIGTVVVLAATITMGILTSRFLWEGENILETSLIQSNLRLGNQVIERIEQQIDTLDTGLFNFLTAQNPDEMIQKVALQAGHLRKPLKGILLLDAQGRPLYPANLAREKPYWEKVLPQVQFPMILPLTAYHLHATLDFKKSALFTFLKFTFPGNPAPFFLVYEYDLDDPPAFLAPFFTDLEKTCYVSVKDYENNVIYGWSSQLSRKFFVEQRFPNVLYRWLLQYSPRNVSELVESERRRRVLNFSLVGISVVLIFSAWFLVYLSRREETRLSLQKEEFFRSVSHELKTPLALIKMFSEMLVLGRGRDESTRREYLEIIFSETERMTFLINNILDFSNLERGIQKFSLEPLDLGEIVTRHLEAFEYLTKKEKVSIRLSIAENLPRIMGDRNALALVLLNLLDNAVKYGKAADRRIEVDLAATAGTLELRVRDNGIGIPPSEQNRVFEKFFRSGNIAVRRVRGSGIGLSLVRYIVTAHQGTVGVESTPGEGSTFTITFPVIRPARTS